jgi:zinc transport system permease protein
MEVIHQLIKEFLPFSWASYGFMRNALMGIVLITPLLGVLGTMVVSNRMVFFSDVLGHSALTGVAIGVVLGIAQPTWSVIMFCVFLAVLINVFKAHSQASSDTVLGVFFAVVVAVGVVILSRGGGFAKYSTFLVGDILSITDVQIKILGVLLVLVLVYWFWAANRLVMVSLNQSIARSRGISVFFTETCFSVVLAIIVAVSIRYVGILIINSLLVLPAAGARIMAKRFSDYTTIAVLISLVSGVAGLIVSFYGNTATGATIVLFCAFFYILAVVMKACKVL